MFGRALATVTRQAAQRGVRSYHGERARPIATFNDLPVPQGCWKEAYNRDQKKFTTILIVGFVTLTGTITIGRMTGWLFFNATVPKAD